MKVREKKYGSSQRIDFKGIEKKCQLHLSKHNFLKTVIQNLGHKLIRVEQYSIKH